MPNDDDFVDSIEYNSTRETIHVDNNNFSVRISFYYCVRLWIMYNVHAANVYL